MRLFIIDLFSWLYVYGDARFIGYAVLAIIVLWSGVRLLLYVPPAPCKDNGMPFRRYQVFPEIKVRMEQQLQFFIKEAFEDSDNLYLSFDAGQTWHAFGVNGYKYHRHKKILTRQHYLFISGVNWEYDLRQTLIEEIKKSGKIAFERPEAWEMIQKLRDVGVHVAYLR